MLVMALLALAGCGDSPLLIRTEYRVVVPPDTYFVCEPLKYPDHRRMTDRQLALYLVEHERVHSECVRHVLAIREFLAKAAEEIK